MRNKTSLIEVGALILATIMLSLAIGWQWDEHLSSEEITDITLKENYTPVLMDKNVTLKNINYATINDGGYVQLKSGLKVYCPKSIFMLHYMPKTTLHESVGEENGIVYKHNGWYIHNYYNLKVAEEEVVSLITSCTEEYNKNKKSWK
jgi:hypothetical protein